MAEIERINILEHANDILQAVHNGVLLTTQPSDKVNRMVIEFGEIVDS